MPIVEFETLPDDARVWVFGSDRPLRGERADRMLAVVDAHLSQWAAHGSPLRSARDWRDDRFLTIAVDQRTAGASGCSIDALFRQLQSLEREVGASLVGGGRVFYRDASGIVQSVDRGELAALAESGAIDDDSHVFDPTLTTLGDWRRSFERRAADSWHAQLLAR